MSLKWDFSEFNEFADRLSNVAKFKSYIEEATDEIAKVLLEMLRKYTPVKSGNLRSGWNANYTIVQTATGFQVKLTNKATNAKGYQYGYDVNDGHYSYNQYNVGGSPYEVKHRTPKIYTVEGANTSSTYVFGHFFVEKAVVETRGLLDSIIYAQLEKWFRWCCNG